MNTQQHIDHLIALGYDADLFSHAEIADSLQLHRAS